MTRSRKTALLCALALSIVITLVVTLWPTPVERPIFRLVWDTLESATRMGLPPKINHRLIDVFANALLFLPLGMLLTALLPPNFSWCAPLAAFFLSLTLEFTQFLSLPNRTASFVDVACNTAGAVVGSMIVIAIQVARDRARFRAASSS
jgi:glycopeptide antibiotics resistance protein